jgi:hypothetical protein
MGSWTELDDSDWCDYHHDPEEQPTNHVSRRAPGYVEVVRSWRTFANNAPTEKDVEGCSFRGQIFAGPRRGWGDRTQCPECSTQLILRAKLKEIYHDTPRRRTVLQL